MSFTSDFIENFEDRDRIADILDRLARLEHLILGRSKEEAPERYLSAPQLCTRYGVTAMTVRRWRRAPEINFPAPDLCVNGRDAWKEATIALWERTRVTRKAGTAGKKFTSISQV